MPGLAVGAGLSAVGAVPARLCIVFVCVHTHTHTHASVHTHTHTHTQTNKQTNKQTGTHTHTHVHAYGKVRGDGKWADRALVMVGDWWWRGGGCWNAPGASRASRAMVEYMCAKACVFIAMRT